MSWSLALIHVQGHEHHPWGFLCHPHSSSSSPTHHNVGASSHSALEGAGLTTGVCAAPGSGEARPRNTGSRLLGPADHFKVWSPPPAQTPKRPSHLQLWHSPDLSHHGKSEAHIWARETRCPQAPTPSSICLHQNAGEDSVTRTEENWGT